MNQVSTNHLGLAYLGLWRHKEESQKPKQREGERSKKAQRDEKYFCCNLKENTTLESLLLWTKIYYTNTILKVMFYTNNFFVYISKTWTWTRIIYYSCAFWFFPFEFFLSNHILQNSNHPHALKPFLKLNNIRMVLLKISSKNLFLSTTL